MINAEQGLNNIGTGDRVADVVVAVIDTGSPSKGSRAWNSSEWVEGEYDFSGDFDATDPSQQWNIPIMGLTELMLQQQLQQKMMGRI